MAAAKGWSGGGDIKTHLRQNQLLWGLIGKGGVKAEEGSATISEFLAG